MEDKIKLSNYLNYLYNEVVEARKYADLKSIQTAKEYAKDEYLKYFKAPRFTMPSVSIEVPIKISELDADIKYEVEVDDDELIKDVNARILLYNQSHNFNLRPIDNKFLKGNDYKGTLDFIKNAVKYSNKNELLDKIRMRSPSIPIIDQKDSNPSTRIKDKLKDRDNIRILKSNDEVDEKDEVQKIISEALLDRSRITSAKLNNIYIDPNTTRSSDKGKILLKMNVELLDEGIQIKSVKDEKGNNIEEITID